MLTTQWTPEPRARLGPEAGPRYSPGPRLGVLPSLGKHPEPRDWLGTEPSYLGPESGPRLGGPSCVMCHVRTVRYTTYRI